MGKYTPIVDKVYLSFQAILPPVDTPLTPALLPSCVPDQKLLNLALLRAFVCLRSMLPIHNLSTAILTATVATLQNIHTFSNVNHH
jgi:hypothetical protein